MLLGMAVIFVSAGTYAWFSDLESSAGNSFTSGIINIAVDGQDKWSNTYQVTQANGETHFKPSQKGAIAYPVKNLGNNPADIWKRISGVSVSENYDSTDPNIIEHMDYSLMLDNHWKISPSNALGIPAISEKWIYLGRLAPGQTILVEQVFRLNKDKTHKDWNPNGKMLFDDEVFGLQVTGATNPVPELPGYGR
jgi:predicted ribosomally synthesized peptide with SipW-like signal peptide